LFAFLSLCGAMSAQDKNSTSPQRGSDLDIVNKRPTYNTLFKEFKRLRSQNDSLWTALDTLEAQVKRLEAQKERELRLMSTLSPAVDVSNENILKDTIANDENADSVVLFQTNVSDEELVKRLNDMHSIITIPFNETVKKYMLLYSERSRAQMERIIGDSEYYFPIFEEAFSNYDMPLELKYLSIVESSLKPKAVSRAGAKGMWQFMYNTAKSYGLEINSYVDERLDTYKSVDAAARTLQNAYNAFGDWCLAISAYNCGAGNVTRAIQQAGGSREFWDIYPYLPKETRGFMPAFVGAMYTMVYSREHGLHSNGNPMPEKVDTIQIHRKLHFKQINELVGVPMDILDLLNPQYIHNIIPGEGTYILRLPEQWAERFAKFNNDDLYNYRAEELFAQVITDEAAAKQKSGSASSVRYTVKSGDTLSRIASKYGVTIDKIKRANGLKSNVIRIGQRLTIPQ